MKRTEEASDTDTRRGMESAALAGVSKGVIDLVINYYSNSKECLKFVKNLPGPLPQVTF